MVSLKFSLLTVFLLVLLTINVNCKDENKKAAEAETKGNEDKVVEEESDEESADGNKEKKINEDDYDEIGEKFLSLLSENLRFKILKNKAANEGLLDQEQFKREPLTKQELDEVQAALVQAMQPLFGQFVQELAIDDKDLKNKTADPALELDPPKVDIKKKPKDEPKEKKTDKKTPPTDRKKTDDKPTKKEKPTKETKQDDTKKETQKDKVKRETDKEKKKTGKAKDEKKDKKQKEEL